MSDCPYFQTTQLFTKSTKNILDLINIVKLSIKIQSFFKVLFIYTSSVLSEKKIIKIKLKQTKYSIQNNSKKRKVFRNISNEKEVRENEIYLTKEVKDFCNENIKTMKKEITKDTR